MTKSLHHKIMHIPRLIAQNASPMAMRIKTILWGHDSAVKQTERAINGVAPIKKLEKKLGF